MFKKTKAKKADAYRMKGYQSTLRMPSYSAYGGGDDFNFRYFQGI